MNPPETLLQRKHRLVAQSAALRVALAHDCDFLRPPLAWADRVGEGARWLARRPLLVVAVGTAVAVAWPRRAWGWARRSLSLWQAWQSWQGGRNWLAALVAQQVPED